MIITIGGKYGSGGKRIAELAAKLLDYKLCDDDIISEAVKNSNVDMTEETFRFFDESQGDAPVSEITKLSSIQRSNYLGMVGSLSMDVLPLDRQMAKVQREVFNRFADEGDCILMGRCADHYLAGRDDCIRIFVVDEIDNRIRRIMEHFDIDEKSAKKAIKKTDKRREDYYSFFTGKQWGDLANYDMIIHCDFLGEEGTAQMLKSIVEIKQSAK